MAKGPYLTDEIRELIADIYREDPPIKPTRARGLLLDRMRERGLNEFFGSNYPSVSAVSKALKEFRRIDQERTPQSKKLDGPWSILTLAEYPISPEALPVVLEEWMTAQIRDRPLTIREALWLDRLYPLARAVGKRLKSENIAIDFPSITDDNIPMHLLSGISKYFTTGERVAELTDRKVAPVFEQILWSFMTGLELGPEVLERTTGRLGKVYSTGKEQRIRVTKEELAYWEAILRKLGYSDPEE